MKVFPSLAAVGPKFVTRNEEEFFEVIKNFKVSNGGGNCASQPILKAIERGIESSLPRSFVLVLTDTSASDQDLEASVLQSIQEKQSSIYFLLTGNCSDRAIYGKLSDASNGLLLEQEKRDLGNVLRKLPEVLYNQNVLLKLQRTSASFGGLELVVDNNIKMVTIGVSDRNTDLVITEPTGGVVEGEEVFQGNWKIIKIQSPPPGFWDLNIRSTAVPKTIRVVGLSELILDFGFSQAPLEFFNQSSFTPTLGMKNTLSIRAENSYNTPNLTKGQLSFPQSKESPIELSLKFNSTTQLFTTDSFEPPRSAFQLSVHGVDEQGIAINRILSRHIQAAIGSPPELLFNEESRKILAGSDFKVTCQIRSFGVASSLILKSDKTILRTVFSDADPKLVFEKKQLETGDSGIYSCSARNEFGTREKVMQLTVVPPPPQIELLGDAIEGKQELEIKCHLQERENLMWTVNGEKIQTILDRGSYECNRNSLVLKNLHRNMSGNYSCTANSSTQIAVNVQYPVQKLKTGSTTVVFEVGKPITINCGLIGNPKPTIQWFNYEAFRPNDRQELVSFAAEERFDGMSITCTGRNNLSLGPVNNEILLKRKLTVEIKQTPDPVEAGKSVTLGCKAPPDARIEWTINGLGLESFPSRVVERAQELTILRVSEDEPLLVECTMKTSFDSAKASKKIQGKPDGFINNISSELNSLPLAVIPAPAPQQKTVAPVIDEKSFEDYYLLDEENDHISLNCRATGVPAPKVTWTRAAHLVTNGSKLNITLDMADGEYNCVAENSAGTAVKWLIVERQVAPVNVIEETVNLNEGDTLNYSCPIIRNQKVSPNDILWTSDRLNYRGDNLLLIHASPSDTGVYSCCLPKGSVCARVRIVVKAKRKQHEVINRYVEVSPGQHLNLQCEGFFSFGARFEWWKSGQQVDTARALILKGSMESEGAYKCLSFDESNEYEVQYQVAFKQPPEVIKISQDPMAIGQEVIECAATGHPQPVIAWLRGGRKVVSTTLIQYGKDMLIDSLKSGHLIVVGTDGQGYATKESESHFLLLRQQTQSEEQFGLLQRNNNRVSLKWIVPRKTEAAGTWTCVAMNKWGTRNQTINIQPHEQEGAKTPELLDGETEHETHAVVQGLPLILECRVGLTLGHQIRWSKSNRPLASSHRWTIKENGNKLIIWEVKLDDAGSFECAQESSTGSVKKSFLVQILEPPQIQQASRMSTDDVVNKLSVLKGHSTVLQCPINGSPEPKITWSQLHFAANRSRRLLPLNKEGRNLTILPKEQTEFYQCSGESSLGNSQALFEIETESRPSIKNQNLTKLTPKLFTSILLPCWTEGHPLPNITWYKNTKVLTPKLRIRISANSQVVKISNIRSEDDNGVYSCIARNYLGSVSKTFSVQVQLPTLLSPWTKWTNCSESCGLGTRQRTRECLFWNGQTASTDKTPQCAGEKMETEECLVRECPVDGVWSEWTPWSPCSATCKSNVVEPTPSIKYRHRDCANPAPAFGGSPCRGSSYQQEVCEVPFCPIDGGWSPFSDWSTCSASCGVGMQVRNRICSSPVPQFNGRECDGEAFEVKHCNEGICSQLISSPAATSPATATALATEWSLWSEWGECTAACGSGFKSRTRKCLTGNCAGENIEFQQCEGRHCEARLEEEKSYRWYLNPQARVDKYQATASISSSSSSSQEEDVDDEVEIEYGAEKLSLFHLPKQQHQKYPSNYFNPQVSITLESLIPLTKDVSSIHFASATATQQQQRETNGSSQSCGLGFEFRNGFCEGKRMRLQLITIIRQLQI